MKTIKTTPTNQQLNKRAGFTLLELLAVITIISILLALILPAITGAFGNARNAEVAAEFTQLTSAIQAFSADNGGLHPWSSIQLSESGTSWTSESRSKIRRLWPQINFAVARDFNGDGDTTDDVVLTAGECLVFFLGGMRRVGSSALDGFSKNPADPFNRTGDNRTQAYHDFDPDRLVDTDGDGMLEYVDSLPDQSTPLFYVSSNNGQGYSKSDGSLNYYVQTDQSTPWNKDTFQIISPGEDGQYGFDPAPNPFDSSGGATDSRPTFGEGFDVPREQADNIASFNSGGTLGR